MKKHPLGYFFLYNSKTHMNLTLKINIEEVSAAVALMFTRKSLNPCSIDRGNL